jgi:hypothetical protein
MSESTVDQHYAHLLALLQDEPQSVVEGAVAGFNLRLQRTWKERRKQGIPTRPMTEVEAGLDQVARDLTEGLRSLSRKRRKERTSR